MSNFTTENLIPYTGTILPGQRLIKRKDGTFLPVGVAASPVAPSPGTSTDFYMCTHVSSDSSMTWSGRKAVLNNGIYSLQSNSTEGLHYSSIYPVINKVYTEDALAVISRLYGVLPTAGLVFYAPLTAQTAQAQTGQALTYVNVDFTTLQGIRCAKLGKTPNDSYIQASAQTLPSGQSARSVSVWVNTNATNAILYGYGSAATNCAWILAANFWSQYGNSISWSVNSLTDSWHNFITTYDGTTVKCYVDGQLKGQSGFGLNTYTTQQYKLYLGASDNLRQVKGTNYMAEFRVYNRVLEQDQIQLLASAF